MSAPRQQLETSSGYAIRGLQGRVIEAIGREIVGGTVEPGELLPREGELTERFGVSRTSVREAMKVLAAKGLVEIRPKTGTRVRDPDLWGIFDSDILRWHALEGTGEAFMRDLIELRQLLEPAAARLAAARSDMADLRRIERASTRMRESSQDHLAYAERDVDFHMAVYRASHNVMLQRFGRLVADFMQLSFGVQQRARSAAADFLEDAEAHAEVFRQINRGDAEAAGRSMLEVVLDGKSALIEALADEPQEGAP